jgi:hypothetical protein
MTNDQIFNNQGGKATKGPGTNDYELIMTNLPDSDLPGNSRVNGRPA